MRGINLLFFLLLSFAATSKAEGPLFKNKDTYTQQEFDNVYRDLRGKLSLLSIFSSSNTWTASQVFNSTMTFKASLGATFSSTGGNGLRIYGAAGAHQWDLYLNGNNLRVSDNTGGGSFVIDQTLNLVSTGGSGLNIYGGSGTHQWDVYLNGTNLRLSDNTGGGSFVSDQVITPSAGIKATTTNDNATNGNYGEYITSSTTGGGPILTTGHYYDVISTFTLTAGDWELRAGAVFLSNGASFSSIQQELCIGTSPGDSTAGCADGLNYFYNNASLPTTWLTNPMVIPPFRVSIAGNQNYFLKGYIAVVTSGSPKIRASLSARRIR